MQEEFTKIRQVERFVYDAGLADLSKVRSLAARNCSFDDDRARRLRWVHFQTPLDALHFKTRRNGTVTFQVETYPDDKREKVFEAVRVWARETRALVDETLKSFGE